MSSAKAVKLAAADGILTMAWTVVTSSFGAASLVLGDYLEWNGDRTPLLYGIILAVNMVFVELSVACGGATWNPTAPVAFYVAGASQETVLDIALRIVFMLIGAAAGILTVHQVLPQTYMHTLGPGPTLKVGIYQGAVAEGLLTFVITFIVLATVLYATENRFLQTPVIVASALTLVRYAGSFTGPAMNPTDAFAWAFFNSQHTSKEHLYVYWLPPFVGTILAALAFRKLLVSPPVPSPSPPPPSATSGTDGREKDD